MTGGRNAMKKRTDIQAMYLDGARTDPSTRLKKVNTNTPKPHKDKHMIRNLLSRISLPTPPIGKILRAVGAALGISFTGVFAGADAAYMVAVGATVLVFWISGDLQVAKEFKDLITRDDKE